MFVKPRHVNKAATLPRESSSLLTVATPGNYGKILHKP